MKYLGTFMKRIIIGGFTLENITCGMSKARKYAIKIPRLIFTNLSLIKRPSQKPWKSSGSCGTRFQNDWCGTSLRFASLKPINLLLPRLLTVVVVLPHGCHMATCKKSYYFRISLRASITRPKIASSIWIISWIPH